MIQEVVHEEPLMQEPNVRAELARLATTEDFGTYNLITAGLKDFEELLKARPKKLGKRAESDLEFALWKTIESCAGVSWIQKIVDKNKRMEED